MSLKKSIMTLAVLFIGIVSFAQDAERNRPTDKNNLQILPETGDIAIGIQANSFLQYVGNFFGKSNNNNSPSFNGFNNTIFIKKFISQNTAIRASINLSKSGGNTLYTYVRNDNAPSDPLQTSQVTDIRNQRNFNNNIGIALEKRRGYGRLQGFYGAGVLVNFGGNTQTFTYGNEMSNSNPTPTTYNSNNPTARTISTVDSYVGAGVNVFTGIEYFVARKISLQGEVGWQILYNWGNDSKATTETVLNGERVEYTRNTGSGNNSLNYFTNPSSNIGVFFHF